MPIHLQREIENLKKKLLTLSARVETAVRDATLSIENRDYDLAQRIIQNDPRIDSMEVGIEEDCLKILALHQPVAIDLRFIVAVLKINNDLERMGDLAVNIVERALSLMNEPLIKPLIDIPAMATRVQSMIRKSLDAFVKRDSELARTVLVSDDAVDELCGSVYEELIGFMERDPKTVRQGINLMFVARNLERLADHATNIAEDVLFLVEGVDVRHHAETRE